MKEIDKVRWKANYSFSLKFSFPHNTKSICLNAHNSINWFAMYHFINLYAQVHLKVIYCIVVWLHIIKDIRYFLAWNKYFFLWALHLKSYKKTWKRRKSWCLIVYYGTKWLADRTKRYSNAFLFVFGELLIRVR